MDFFPYTYRSKLFSR